MNGLDTHMGKAVPRHAIRPYVKLIGNLLTLYQVLARYSPSISL